MTCDFFSIMSVKELAGSFNCIDMIFSWEINLAKKYDSVNNAFLKLQGQLLYLLRFKGTAW